MLGANVFLHFNFCGWGWEKKWLLSPVAVEISGDFVYNLNEKWENKVLLYDI